MRMRSTLWVLGAVMVGGMMGCGQQPRYYRVSIDTSPLNNLTPSCYSGNTVPTDDRTTNVVDVGQWILWDGVEDRKYLQVGESISYDLGDAPVRITAGDAIVSSEADKPTFTAERTQTGPNRVTRATYTFDKLGETLEGTLALSFSCTGTGCPPSCEASLPFVGRRLDVDPTLQVGNTANN